MRNYPDPYTSSKDYRAWLLGLTRIKQAASPAIAHRTLAIITPAVKVSGTSSENQRFGGLEAVGQLTTATTTGFADIDVPAPVQPLKAIGSCSDAPESCRYRTLLESLDPLAGTHHV